MEYVVIRESQIKITEREIRVVQAAADDVPRKELAAQIGISHRTVESYVSDLLSKLNIKSTPALVAFFMRQGWVK